MPVGMPIMHFFERMPELCFWVLSKLITVYLLKLQ